MSCSVVASLAVIILARECVQSTDINPNKTALSPFPRILGMVSVVLTIESQPSLS
jgi:hypothetical protein